MNKLADNIISLYERHAQTWDAERRRGGWNDKVCHNQFIQSLPRNASVLDLGCGGGSPVAENLVAQGVQVTGVDSSPTLIKLCRSRLSDQEWIIGDIRTVVLGRTFNGILAWDSFFHLQPDDQRAMFEIFAAHAKPKTMLMFNTGPAYGEAIGTYRGDPLYHASLGGEEYRVLLQQHNFGVVQHSIEDAAAGGRTIWLAQAC
ncbi:MAG: class I SAM-dependent DNA methyltransferase [Hyphomicrobiaceae bacterium]